MGAFLRRRGPRGDTKHALKSRGVQWLGPPSPSAGGAVLSALGSHESDRGVQYHSTGRCQAAGSHGSDGDVQYHVSRRFQAAGLHESDGGVKYHATRRFQAAELHENGGGVQYHATRRYPAAGSNLCGQGGGLRQR